MPSSGTRTVENDAERLRERNRELLILNSFAKALSRSLDLDETIRVALAQVAELLHLRTGWVWLLDSDSHDPYLASSLRLPPALRRNPELMEGSCYCLDTYRSGDLSGAANVNVVTCSRLKALVNGTHGLRYHASIPLYSGEQKLGVLNVASTDWRELSEDDLRILHTMGDFLSVAIERARLFERSALAAASEERVRIARDLHDTLAQGLTAIALQLESAEAMLDEKQDVDEARLRIGKALDMTRTSLEEARRSVFELRSAPLRGRKLGEALNRLVRSTADRTDLDIDFVIAGTERLMTEQIELALYRVAQEGLTNIVRHAQANSARLSLKFMKNDVHLSIEDDGKGFDTGRVDSNRFGLIGLNERVNALGGRLTIWSDRQGGTRLEVSIPDG